MGIIRISLLIGSLSLVLSCAEGHCRRAQEGPKDEIQAGATDTQSKSSEEGGHVRVYKYDGSLQCKGGRAVALDEMAKELKGIPVYSKEKKRDGLMHIQVCGSITGMANVFEIPGENLKQAEAKGFKKWNFE